MGDAVKSTMTEEKGKKAFWAKVADVLTEKKDEIAAAVAAKMTEISKDESKITGEPAKVYTAEEVKTTVKFDQVADTVQSDEFVTKATSTPVIETVPLATPVPTGAACRSSCRSSSPSPPARSRKCLTTPSIPHVVG